MRVKFLILFIFLAIISSEVMAQNYRAWEYDGHFSRKNSSNNHFSFTFPIASRHLQQRQYYNWGSNNTAKKDFNEFNPGFIINYKIDAFSNAHIDTNITAGIYKNSYYDPTYLTSMTFETRNSLFLSRKIDFGIELGLTHGYKDNNGDKYAVMPLGQIYVSAEINDSLDFRLGLIPMTLAKPLIPDDFDIVDVITASIVWKPNF